MSLKQRLERLEQLERPVQSGLRDSRPAPASLRRTLGDLRTQMRALLERQAAVRPAAPRGRKRGLSLEDLPFVQHSTPAGLLWQRLDPVAATARVGSVELSFVSEAEPQVLAELALDPAIAGVTASGWLFLDTETTGLQGAGSLAFLIGMASFDEAGRVVVEQLLLPEPGDELAVLERVAERVQAASLIVSFNGKAFDRPLLDGRYVMNRLPPLPQRPHLDLLHVGRRLHQRRLQRCTLKRMELEVLGFDRGHDIDGSEVGPLYAHFLRSGDASALAAIVAHNYADVLSMVALVSLYGQRLPPLVGEDLAGLARTLKRAGATEHAERAAQRACECGGGVEALRIRAALAKSRGDSLGAVRDLEQLCQKSDDPEGRLELAKLYEHKLLCPALALRCIERGTCEDSEAHARRRQRLERKIREGALERRSRRAATPSPVRSVS
jgi:uncharacterized protein YprB with RNaseH-like and TPR domain